MEGRKLINSLIAEAMPKTAEMVRAKRAEYGDRHVTECVSRGLAGEPGWFFAREGPVAVGVPWGDDADVWRLFELQVTTGKAFLMMRPAVAKEAAHGAHS